MTHALIGTACLAGCHGREPLPVNLHDPLRAKDREVTVPDAGTDEPDAARVRPPRRRSDPPDFMPPSAAGAGSAGSRAVRPPIDYAGSGGISGGFAGSAGATPPWFAMCGNGMIEPSENCESTDLNGATCETLGYLGGGGLSCSSSCLYDVSNCRLNPDTPQPDAGSTGSDDDAGVAQP